MAEERLPNEHPGSLKGGFASPGRDRPTDELHRPTRRSRLGRGLMAIRSIGRIHELPIALTLLAMVALIGSFHPSFLGQDSLVNLGRQAAFIGTMALATVFLLSMREIDLSVGSTYGLVAIVAATLMEGGMDPWVAAALGLLLGAGLGAVNGVLANGLGIQTIIVTLGTLSAFRGLALVVSDGRTVVGLPRHHAFFTFFGGDKLGIPVSIWMLLLVTLVLTVVYRRTRFGFMVRAIGSNEQAAHAAGISKSRVRLYALMLQGLVCAIAGLVTLAFLEAAEPNLGTGNELLVIAAAIVGGTALAGGTGTVVGALIGALIIATIRSGLIQFGVSASWTIFATGAVIIGAVALDALIKRRRAALAARGAGFDEKPPPGGSAGVRAWEEGSVRSADDATR
ncbi:MAG: ABC transporter permease [Solirubrobacterales bacterium]